jgi:hypothetical protein
MIYRGMFFWDLLFTFPFAYIILTAAPGLYSPDVTTYPPVEFIEAPNEQCLSKNTALWIGLLGFLRMVSYSANILWR